MTVQVKLHGMAARYFPEVDPHQGMQVDMAEGAVLWDLVKRLKFNRSGVMISVNGVMGRLENQLAPGDQVDVMWLMTGG